MTVYSVSSLRNLMDLSIHGRLKVGFNMPEPTNEEICEELAGLKFSSFWQEALYVPSYSCVDHNCNIVPYDVPCSSRSIFETYHQEQILDLVLVSPNDLGLIPDVKGEYIEFLDFVEYVVENYPSLHLLKPEVFFRIGKRYDISLGTTHLLATDPVLMKEYDYGKKEFRDNYIMGGFRVLGIENRKNPRNVYHLQAQFNSENMPISFYQKCLFAYDSGIVMSGDAELQAFDNMSSQEWDDVCLDNSWELLHPYAFNNACETSG